MLVPMLVPMLARPLAMVGANEPSSGAPPGPSYDTAGLLAFGLLAGYGMQTEGWLPSGSQPTKAQILARVSGRS